MKHPARAFLAFLAVAVVVAAVAGVTAVQQPSESSSPDPGRPEHRGTTTSHSTAGQRVVTASTPSQTLKGDLLLAVVTQRPASITPPAGWTLVLRTGAGPELTSTIYQRTATANGVSSYDFASTNGRPTTITISAYARVDRVLASAGDDGRGRSVVAPAITPPRAGTMLVGVFTSVAPHKITPPASMTAAASPAADTNGRPGLLIATQPYTATVSTGTRTATMHSASPNVAQLLLLGTQTPNQSNPSSA